MTIFAGWQQVGSGDWSNTKAMSTLNGKLYIVVSKLWKVDSDNGTWQQLGSGDWSNTTAMATLNGKLYITAAGKLWKVNPDNGTWQQVGSGDWSNTKAMSTLNGKLYIVVSKLWKVDSDNGTWQQLGSGDWSNTTAMTTLNGKLYIIAAGKLWEVNPDNGTWQQLGSGDWSNTKAMTALKGKLYATVTKQWEINPDNGTWQQFSLGNWSNTTAMTPLNDKLYATADGKLWEIAKRSWISDNGSIHFNLMTFNVRNANKTAEIVKTIRESNANVIGLQEVDTQSQIDNLVKSLGFCGIKHGVAGLGQGQGRTGILSAFPILDSNSCGVKIEVSPTFSAWVYNIHAIYFPYGPYQLNGISYKNFPPYPQTDPERVIKTIRDQETKRGSEIDFFIKEINSIINKEIPIFFVGDFNEPSHLDWTQAAKNKGIFPEVVEWSASKKIARAGLIDSWRQLFSEIYRSGHTWSPVSKKVLTDNGQIINEPEDRIDIIYYYPNKNVELLDAKITSKTDEPVHPPNFTSIDIKLDDFPSDHRSVTAYFNIKIR